MAPAKSRMPLHTEPSRSGDSSVKVANLDTVEYEMSMLGRGEARDGSCGWRGIQQWQFNCAGSEKYDQQGGNDCQANFCGRVL